MNKAMSNKMWRKTHLFEGEVLCKSVYRDGKATIVPVDKNNHKVELVIINDKAYLK